MFVKTMAKFVGKLDANALLGFIKENIDPNAESMIETEDRMIEPKYHAEIIFLSGKKGIVNRISGFINFTYNGKRCSLYYLHHDSVWLEKYTFKQNIKQGTQELNGEVTQLSLGYNVTAVEIMKKIAEFFGGYIQENDCSGKWFHKVEKAKEQEQA